MAFALFQHTIANYLSRFSAFERIGGGRWIWTGEHKKVLKPKYAKNVAVATPAPGVLPRSTPAHQPHPPELIVNGVVNNAFPSTAQGFSPGPGFIASGHFLNMYSVATHDFLGSVQG